MKFFLLGPTVAGNENDYRDDFQKVAILCRQHWKFSKNIVNRFVFNGGFSLTKGSQSRHTF